MDRTRSSMALGGSTCPETCRTRGFTLIEMMVAVGILGVVVAGVMQSFVVQNQAYTVTDQVIEAQQNLRVVAWVLERDARMTGFMVPEAASLCAIDRTNAPDSVWFTDSDAIDTAGQASSELGAEVQSGYSGSNGLASLQLEDALLDGQPFYDLDGDGSADSDFQPDAGAILVDTNDPARGTACGIVQAVAGNAVDVVFQNAITPSPGGRVVLIPAHVYTIDTTGPTPSLLRNGRLIATSVEDLQLAYFFDRNRDGVIDDPTLATGELPGAEGNAPIYDSDDWDHSELREVRINLVVRTRATDRDNQEGLFQATGNRIAPVGNDGFRRRVHSSTVRVRNVGFRGSAT